MILIIDFGSQTTHLISRRIRDMGVDVKITNPQNVLIEIKNKQPSGIILSGGPASVYEKNAPTVDKNIFNTGIPILGICYGWQLTALLLGGKVVKGNREYGPTKTSVHNKGALFKNVKTKEFTVWMSHGDEVLNLPVGFEYHTSTPGIKAAGVGCFEKKIFGVQFHPEVEHTQEGKRILQTFVENICGEKINEKILDVSEVIEKVKSVFSSDSKKVKAIAAVSGGVDSTVASAIVAKSIGKRFIPIFCDNGLMRSNTRQEVDYIFNKILKVKPIIIDCRKEFLKALKGVTDPEKKRMIIGNLYIKIFEKEAKKHPDIAFLVQGTIYSDVIESKGSKNAAKIKSHHNVGGLPEKMHLKLLEPVKNFYKDEVRQLGKQLGLPDEILQKQPFPGPGQAIRIIGEITAERLEKQQLADNIVLEVIKEEGWYDKVFQSFSILTGVNTTAVKGDGRSYGELVGVRIYDSSDIMTAGWTHLPYEVLQKISSRIVNEVPDVSRVAYDITTKPPATMEWE
ncbi:glutamine-hydrolyzing GMP synthase [Patescibacteria group bacterium]